jgi:hypothetical protein
MPQIYVAFQTVGPAPGGRKASGSETNIKKAIREFINTEWRIVLYDFPANVATVCLLIEGDYTKWPQPVQFEDVRVNESGQVRKKAAPDVGTVQSQQ